MRVKLQLYHNIASSLRPMSITHSSFLLISPSHPPPPLQLQNAKMSTVHRFSHALRRSQASHENGVMFLIRRKPENYYGFEIVESLTGDHEEVIGDHVFEDAGNPPRLIDFTKGAEEDHATCDKGSGYEMLLSVIRRCLNLELESSGFDDHS